MPLEPPPDMPAIKHAQVLEFAAQDVADGKALAPHPELLAALKAAAALVRASAPLPAPEP